MPRKRDQAKERRGAIYQDQHARAWETTYDLQTLGTCQAPQPWRWSAPVIPPPPYFAEFRDRPLVYEINYNRWIDDLEVSAREYRARCVEVARKMNQEPESAMVREIVGREPYPADLAKACRAGNKWALGLTRSKNDQGEMVQDWMTRYPPWAAEYKEYWAPEKRPERAFEDVDLTDDGVVPVAAGTLPDEKYGELEEKYDPEGLGGQRQKVVKMKSRPEPKETQHVA